MTFFGLVLVAIVLFMCGAELEKGLAKIAAAIAEISKPSHNIAMPKLPTVDECYKAIPFPENERECAMFVAGIAEAHKFICRQLSA